MSTQTFLDRTASLSIDEDDVLVVHPDVVPAAALAPLLRLGDKQGFVVADMTDLDAFSPIPASSSRPGRSTSYGASYGVTR
jgi:hypothetical protein